MKMYKVFKDNIITTMKVYAITNIIILIINDTIVNDTIVFIKIWHYIFNSTITRDTFYNEILNYSQTDWLINLKRKDL